MDGNSKSAKRQKRVLSDDLLYNSSLEKHGFFMERLAAALHLDLGIYIRSAFDITSDGDYRGSMAAYKSILARARTEDCLNGSVVKSVFRECPFVLSRKAKFALRAWACYAGVQGVPEKPGAIDTSAKDPQACSVFQLCIFFPDRSD